MQQQAQQPVQEKPAITQKPVATAQAQQKPVAGKPMQPVVSTGQPKSKWWLWLIVIIVSLGAGFAIGYFLM